MDFFYCLFEKNVFHLLWRKDPGGLWGHLILWEFHQLEQYCAMCTNSLNWPGMLQPMLPATKSMFVPYNHKTLAVGCYLRFCFHLEAVRILATLVWFPELPKSHPSTHTWHFMLAWVLSHCSGTWLFCSPVDCSLSGSSILGILWARILERVAICPPSGDLPDPGIKLTSPALQVDSWPTGPPGKPMTFYSTILLGFCYI